MICILTIEEHEILHGLAPLSWPVYCYLRQYMDAKTGLVGQRWPVSLRIISTNCYVEPGPGKRDTGFPTVGKIRTIINALIGIGLIEPRTSVSPRCKRLILFLPIAFKNCMEVHQ